MLGIPLRGFDEVHPTEQTRCVGEPARTRVREPAGPTGRAQGRSRGFTLFELMIVVTVIAVLAVMVIPSILNARKSANETSAIAFLKMAVGVNIQYRVRFGTFPSQPTDLFNAGFIDPSQDPSGYTLTLASTSGTWSLEADPNLAGQTGDRSFYVDESGVIRFSMTAPATSTSPPLGES